MTNGAASWELGLVAGPKHMKAAEGGCAGRLITGFTLVAFFLIFWRLSILQYYAANFSSLLRPYFRNCF